MTMLTRFTPPAQQTVVRAGALALDAGTEVLGTGHLLAALAEIEPSCLPLRALGLGPGDVLGEIRRHGGRGPGDGDAELLAALGIDLGEIRRRVRDATSLDADDARLWRLHRSRTLPLRVTLTGPRGRIRLNEHGRKVIEVAAWARRRAHRPRSACEDLLWGLLADGSNDSVRILHRLGVDLHRLWNDLRRRHAAA